MGKSVAKKLSEFRNVYFRKKIFENFSPRQVYILEFYILSEFAFLGETLINQNHQNHENSRKQVRCQSERTSKNYAKIRKFIPKYK